MEVARAGFAAAPPVDPPRILRPLLRFRRLSAPALETVRRALEEDDGFRRRVAAALDDDPARDVGDAGRLLLLHPEGWSADLRRLEEAAASDAGAAADRADERTARKRLRLVEDEARRLEDLVTALRAQLTTVRAELAAERQVRQQGEADAAALAARVHGLGRERDAAHRRASGLDTETAQLRRRLATAEEGRAGEVPAERAPPPGPAPAPVAVEDLRAAIAEAGAAAVALGRALDAATRALDGGATEATSAGPSGRGSSSRTTGPPPPRAPAGRLPVALPPGLFDDDPVAADHLVRVRGCVLVVDGYNASLGRWPQLPIAEQRRRLVDAASGLAARCGPDVHIVFDGADEREHGRALARRGVHVRFSARGVEADDVILDQIDRLPATAPVVVATDDRRVRREAAARGANVITQEQLFSLL